MPTTTTTLARLLVLLLLVLSLASCQRATYSFQPVASQRVTGLPAAQPDSSRYAEAATPTLSTIALPAARQQPARRHLRRQRAGMAHRAAAPAMPLLLRAVLASRPARRAVAAAAPAKAGVAEQPPLRRRSKVLAVVLAGLSLAYPFGAQYYYLGYTERGLTVLAIYLLALLLLLLNLPLALSSSASLGPLGVAAVVLYAGLVLFQLYDLIRILRGDLKPRDGEYRQRPSA